MGQAPVPLLLASARPTVDAYGGVGSRLGSGAGPILRSAWAPAPTGARPGLEATLRQGSPPAVGPAAFLPPTARVPAAAFLPLHTTNLGPRPSEAHGGSAGADRERHVGTGAAAADGGGGAAGKAMATVESGAATAKPAASAGSGSSGAAGAAAKRALSAPVPGSRRSGAQSAGTTKEGAAAGLRGDADASDGDEEMSEATSYSSCRSCSYKSYDCSSGGSDQERNADEEGCDGPDHRGDATSGGVSGSLGLGAAAAVGKRTLAAAVATDGCGGGAPEPVIADADHTTAAENVVAGGDGSSCGASGGAGASGGRTAPPNQPRGPKRSRASYNRHAPPWPLVPRPGRPGTLRI
jgi:hypothetical protein